jgi:hypothetical protein
MPHVWTDPTRVALFAVDSLVALTALGGGAMLTTGLEEDRFPADWLTSTPFSSYAIPGLILSGAVGGSAAIAAVATIRGPHGGGLASMLSGSVPLGWIGGEVAILSGRRPEAVSPMELLYLAGGVATLGLGFRVREASRHR